LKNGGKTAKFMGHKIGSRVRRRVTKKIPRRKHFAIEL
jgi:hypothetical protein